MTAREKKAQYLKEWKSRNRERVREYHKEYMREYRKNNKEKIKQINERYWTKKAEKEGAE